MSLSTKILTASAVSALLLGGTASAQQGNQAQQPQQPANQGQQQAQNRATQQQDQQQARQGQRRFQQVRGEIVDLRRAGVRGTGRQNVLALVETPQGRRTVVDLGYGIRGEQLQPGQRIAVRGERVQLSPNRSVVLANAIRLNGQTYTVNRQARQQADRAEPLHYRQVRGEIVGLQRANLRGTDRQNVLALLETPAGKRVTVDLGTGVRGQRLQMGQRIAVRGEPIRLGQNRTVLLAQAVRTGGRTYDINRPGDMGYKQVRGTISDIRQARLADNANRNVLALIETPAGQRAVVDLGQGIRGLQPNKQIAARGTPVMVGPDRVVLLANAARLDDRTYDINRVILMPQPNMAVAE